MLAPSAPPQRHIDRCAAEMLMPRDTRNDDWSVPIERCGLNVSA